MAKAAWKEMEPPAVGSRWDRWSSLGEYGTNLTVRVMAVVEGYVMHRRAGAAPMLTRMSDWHGQYFLKSQPSKRAPLIAQDKGAE